ncbi:putative histone H2A.Z-specific chaperone CHZ1-like [Homarus americanus]|uniref:Putative histone H2A.Z-specific chaperone CHZ1-like n=1 Tax=Homarus americanus TaxID=6706 RepID=A0A8J5JYE9_HOMAM|nr:putative histone H2A.Z-specific chaperone CHZ1-like [Homarus americanus]
MKAVVCLVVVILVYLAGFGHASVIKGKVSFSNVPTQVQEVKQVEEEQQGDGDDLIKDPDWVPTAEDYHYEDEDEDEDELWDYADDPEWQPEYEDEDEDELWSSDDDPDWQPEDEDELWSSDDDPDWQPEGEDKGEIKNIVYGKIVQQIVQLLHTDVKGLPCQDESISANDTVQQIANKIYSVNMDTGAARQVLRQSLALAKPDNILLHNLSAEQDLDQHKSEEQGVILEHHPTVLEMHSNNNYHNLPSRKNKRHVHCPVSPVGGYKQYQYGNKGVDVSELSHGVEPLGGGGQHVDLSTGVEPERGDDDDFSLGDWLEHQWGHVSDTAESVGDKISDVADNVFDAASHVAGTAHDVASHTIDKIQDAAESVGEHVVTAYHHARESVPRLKTYIASAFSKRLGTCNSATVGVKVPQLGVGGEGAETTESFNMVRGSEVLDKLQQKLQEGDAQVAEFFQLVGQKMETWSQQQVPENVDEGLIIHHNQLEQEGHNHQQEGGHQQSGHTEQLVPDLFQDEEIRIHLSKLVEVGVLAQDDLVVFSQQEQQQEQHEPAVKSRS